MIGYRKMSSITYFKESWIINSLKKLLSYKLSTRFAKSDTLNNQMHTASATIFLSLYFVDFEAQRLRCCKNYCRVCLAWVYTTASVNFKKPIL
jgi:hypothetical protein